MPTSTIFHHKFAQSFAPDGILTLKGPGFFVYLKSGGGGGGPPRISAAERRKNLKFGTYVELVNTNVVTKFQYLKSKRFLIMQIYVNYMHVFLFLTITDKMRPFGALFFFSIFVETFNIFLNKKTVQFSFISLFMYFIVLRISHVFLCFCDLCILLFFYMELFEY